MTVEGRSNSRRREPGVFADWPRGGENVSMSMEAVTAPYGVTYIPATWLAIALASDPVVAPRVVECSGWEKFGRPPSVGEFDPRGVLEHHTACLLPVGHDPATCLRVIQQGNTEAPGPISQLLITATPTGVRWDGHTVDPRVYVVAAGRANHAGSCIYPWTSATGVRDNAGAIGIECCGPPTRWPDFLVEFRARVTACLLRTPGWAADRVSTHHESAVNPPGRKIDPSGAWRGEPDLTQTTPWSASRWRQLVAQYLNLPQPTAPVEGEDVEPIYVKGDNNPSVYCLNVVTGRRRYVPNAEASALVAANPHWWEEILTIRQSELDAIPVA